jgi:diguanylate cyclase (GGDEF)-like protein
MQEERARPSIDSSLVEALLAALDTRGGEDLSLRADAALALQVGFHLGLSRTDARALRAAVVLHRVGEPAGGWPALPERVTRLAPLAARLLEQAARARSAGSPAAGNVDADDELLSRAVAEALAVGAPVVLDPLTRLPVARFLFGSVERELERAERMRYPVSLVQLDIDGFRDLNHRHGRAAGDRVLRGVGRALRSTLRPGDQCVRATGDEFVIIIPGVGAEGIAAVLARLDTALARHKFAVARGVMATVTASLGAATFPEDARSHEALLAVAEARRLDRLLAHRGRSSDAGRQMRFPGRPDTPVN